MATHFDVGYRLYQRRWLAAALWEFEQHLCSARRHPAEAARTFNAMATCLLAQGEPHQAYVKAELARDTATQLVSGHPQIFYAHLNGALASFRTGDLATARWLSEAALRVGLRTLLPQGRIAQVMMILAAIATESEQYDISFSWLEAAGHYPLSGNQWDVQAALANDRGICCAASDRLEEAEVHFTKALRLFDDTNDQVNVHIERGWARLMAGNHAGALVDATEVVDGLLAHPAQIDLPVAGDGLMLLSALAKSRGDAALSSRLYVHAFAWLATGGHRAHLRRSTRAAISIRSAPGCCQLPEWRALVDLTEVLTAGEHRGPAPAQRFGRSVHDVAPQFATHMGRETMATAAVYSRLPAAARGPATLPAKTLLSRLERGRKSYDAGVLALLDRYDRALVEEGHPYPAVLDRMTREAGTPWDPRAVRRLLLAHAS